MMDPYRNVARYYDRLFESMNKGFKIVGIKMCAPTKGMNILDIGCGTGTQLDLYKEYECNLYGLDSSPAMLEIARTRLGDHAQLDLADAADMPYEDNMFDLVICMLLLHELSPGSQSAVLNEVKRVVKIDGRILLIDFQPGPSRPLQGWISKALIIISELAAGGEHFKNYRQFMADKGLATLIEQQNLKIQNERILAGSTFAIYLVTT